MSDKFCAIAPEVKFIMNGANHKMKAFTTYFFGMFGNSWEVGIPEIKDLSIKGDTVMCFLLSSFHRSKHTKSVARIERLSC